MPNPTKHLLRLLAVAALFVTLTAMPHEAAAQDLNQNEGFNKGGRTALQFLKIGVGARQAAIGEASIASVHDVNSLYWNPAAIRGIASVEASFSYTRWIADLNYVAGAIGARWGRVGTFAFGIAALDYGQIPEAIVGGGGEARTGNTFSGGDLMVGVAYSRTFTDRLSIGVGAKWIRESLFDYSVSTVAYDVGSTYDLGYRGVRLSMAAQNFGGSVKWLGDDSDRNEGYDLPLIFRIGVAANLVGSHADAFFDAGPMNRIVVAAEAVNTNDYSERLNLGAEYWWNDLLALRGGYRFNQNTGRWTAGAGLQPSFGGMTIRVDYAYMSHEFLNAPHRLTLTMAF